MINNRTIGTIIVLAMSSVMLLSSCSQTVQTKTEDDTPKVELNASLPDGLKAQFDAILDAYFQVKDALVAGDAEKTVTSSALLMGAIANVNDGSVPEADRLRWQNRKKELLRYAMSIEQTTVLEEQRVQFEPLSNALYLVLTDIGAGTKPVYKQYCPMAFDDKGAFWLSDNEEILNPYFGDAMLHCGMVKEVLSLNTISNE